MNLFKKILTPFKKFFKHKPTEKEIQSVVGNVWIGKDGRQVIDIIQSIKNADKQGEIIERINAVNAEIKTLEEKKKQLSERKEKIAIIEKPDFSHIEETLQIITNLVQTDKPDSKPRFISKIRTPNEVGSFITNNSLLTQFRQREVARKKKEELHKKQIKEKLVKIEIFVEQGKLDEAKLLIAQIQKEIGNNVKHEIARLNEAIRKLKEKELLILIKRQEEEQKRRDEEAKRIKEEAEQQEEEKKKSLFLSKFEIQYLYHMTDKSNLENILQNGLKSHNYARKNKLMQTDIANNDVNDRRSKKETIYRRSLHDYVPLYFNPKNAMLSVRRKLQDNIVILAIDKMLIYNDNSIFTDGNAANDPTSFFNDTNDLDQLNWKCIRAEYWNNFPDGKRQRMAEVLVFPDIPANHIQKIYCNNKVTLQFVKNTIAKFQSVKIETEIKNNLYF